MDISPAKSSGGKLLLQGKGAMPRPLSTNTQVNFDSPAKKDSSVAPRASAYAHVPYFRVHHDTLREPLLMVNHWGCDPLTTFTFREPRPDEEKWVSDILSPGSMRCISPNSRGWDFSTFSPSSLVPQQPVDFHLPEQTESRRSRLSTSFIATPKRLSAVSSYGSPGSPSLRPSVAQRRALCETESHEIGVFETRVRNAESSAHGTVASETRADLELLFARLGGNLAIKDLHSRLLELNDAKGLASLYHMADRMGFYIFAEQIVVRLTEIYRISAMDTEILSSQSYIALSLQRQGKNSEAYAVYADLHPKYLEAFGQDHVDTICCSVRLGVCMRRQGMFDEADKILHEAYQCSTRVLGDAHRVTLEAVREYILLLLDLARLPEVKTFSDNLRQRHTAALGASDPDTYAAFSVYSWILHHQGQQAAAAENLRTMLVPAITYFGTHHPFILQYRRQLAVLLEGVDVEEGGGIMKDLVIEWTALSGTGSIRSLRSAHDAGVYFARVHNFTDAAEYFRIAAHGFRKLYGPANYFTIMCHSKWARSLFYSQEYAETVRVLEKVHDSVISMVGKDSESRYRAQNNLAIALCRNYQFQAAIDMAREASNGWTGVDHQDPVKAIEALISVQNLAIMLQMLYKFTEAEKLFHRVFNGWNRTLGENHANTILADNNIGLLLRDQRRMQESEPILKKVLKMRTEVLGSDDPDTLESHHNMAVWNKISRNLDEALEQHLYTKKQRLEILGPRHMDTLTTMYNLGLLYTQSESYDEALEVLLECLNDIGATIGWDSPMALNVLNAVANAYSECGDEEKADKYYRKSLAGLEKIYGNAHPDTLRLVRNMATNYHYLKKYDVAEGYWRRAVDGMIQFQGPNHPETLWTAVQLALILEVQFKDIEAAKFYKWVDQGRKNLSQTDMSTLDPQNFSFLHDIERLTRERSPTDQLITNPTLLCLVKAVAENIAIHIIHLTEHFREMWGEKKLFCPRRRSMEVASSDFSLADEVKMLLAAEKSERRQEDVC